MPAGDLSSSALDGSGAPRGPETSFAEPWASSAFDGAALPQSRLLARMGHIDGLRVIRTCAALLKSESPDAHLHLSITSTEKGHLSLPNNDGWV